MAEQRLVEDARVKDLAIEVDAHARELGRREVAVEGTLDRLLRRALRRAAEESDGVAGRAVDAEQRYAVTEHVRGGEEGAVATHRHDEESTRGGTRARGPPRNTTSAPRSSSASSTSRMVDS